MGFRKMAACTVVVLSLGACQTTSSGEMLGTLGGAAAGGLLGSQIGGGTGKLAATAVGTLIGALAGRELGKRLGGTDQRQATLAEESAVLRNEPVTWNNPDTGYRGRVQPTRTYESQAGQLCRDYTHTVYINGRAETARGTACRQTDGTWRLVG